MTRPAARPPLFECGEPPGRAGAHGASLSARPGSFTVILPLPPSTNNLFGNGKRGRYRTDRYDAWITKAGLTLNTQGVQAIAAPRYGVSIGLPLKCRADIDNTAKPILDLLVKHRLIADDRNVTELLIKKTLIGPDCVVSVSGMP